VNLAAALSVAAASIAVFAGAMSRRFSTAPGWRDQRRFSLVAFTAAAYAFLNLATVLRLPPAIVVPTSRLQVASSLLHSWAWLRYSQAFTGIVRSRPTRWLSHGLLLAAAAVIVPGVAFSGAVVDHAFPPLGVVYRDAVPTSFGMVVFAVTIAASSVVLVRFSRAWRSGLRYASVHTLSFAAIMLFAVNDTVATTGAWPAPYLLDTGFVLPILAVYWTIATRFIEEARALDGIRAKLAGDVEERTRDLARAELALAQSERLAALGRFANGVAHEVNNPASVVTANLRWLAEAIAAGDERGDLAEVVEESLGSMRRINDLVRKLVDAGRIAASTPGGSAAVADVVGRAVADARGRAPSVEFRVEVPHELWVRTHSESLAQVLGALLLNAVESLGDGHAGHVVVQAERRPGTVRIEVKDDGRGMPDEVLRRAFDPFFTTKPEGQGAGLGLSVSRGLVEGHGGSLWLESEEGRGTRAVIELPESPPPAEASAPDAAPARP